MTDRGDLDRELAAVRASYNGVRLHAGVGYVTPDGRAPRPRRGIRHARRAGHVRARQARLAYFGRPTLRAGLGARSAPRRSVRNRALSDVS
jgi:hypothetical protein